MYLVDTSIVSLFAPSRKLGIAEIAIAEWLQRASDHLHLSAMTASEIETGIARLNRAGTTAKASALATWLETIVGLYSARIHAFDIETARLAGQLYDRAIGNGHTPSFQDAAIAATAEIRQLTIITRNAAHFAPFATSFLNPYDGIPVNE